MSRADRRVAYIGYAGAFQDQDAPLVLDAMSALGVPCERVAWDDPAADWAAFDIAVVRSTWDYHRRREQFLAWARQTASQTRLFNPASVLEWNTDKTYLGLLADRGVPIVPTKWVSPGADVPGVDYRDIVVKPAVSAGAEDTIRTTHAGAAAEHIAAIHSSRRTAMIQPYVTSLDDVGELSLLYFGGELSHSVRRAAGLTPEGPQPNSTYVAFTPSAEQLAVADQVLAAVDERDDLLYARVDLVTLDDGSYALLELELTEPYLFLDLDPAAAHRLAVAIAARL